MVEDPTGRETTWWGTAFDVDYRRADGSNLRADVVAFGLGDLAGGGSPVAKGLPVEIVGSREGGYGLSLEIGSDAMPIPNQPAPELHATWRTFSGSPPTGTSIARYIGGGIVLVAFLVLGILLNRREERE